MPGPFLDAAARAGFQRAITAIEAASSAEIVVAIRRRSAAYLHANVAAGVVAAFAVLAVMLFGEHVFALSSILVDPLVAGGLAGAVVELLPGVKRRLSPAALRHREILRAARATFVERGVHNTRDRTGILVYVSWLEREVVLVLDSGITLPAELQPTTERAMTAAMPAGGAEVAQALAALAPALATAAPHRDDDRNELPDVIDSDLERRGRA